MKKIFFVCLLMMLFLLGACTNDGGEDSLTESGVEESEIALDMDGSGRSANMSDEAERIGQEESAALLDQVMEENRKVIYTGYMGVETESYSSLTSILEEKIAALGGYVIDSQMYRGNENDEVNGVITVRVPQEEFASFIEFVESQSKVIERTISGQDVTEDYVDLESRLTSKRAVEERLLEFMEQAEETEDLLAISQDLAQVQEDIETIVGRMNYLKNRTEFASLTIHIYEDKLSLSSINDNQLNTWEKTKKQFLRSINFIVASFSWLIIFIAGNAPVIGLAAVIVLFIWLYVKRRNKKSSREE